MAKNKIKQCAVFTYDQFPYMVVHDVLKVHDDGGIEFAQGFSRYANSLIAIFPYKMKKEIEDRLDYMKVQYKLAQEDSRNKLLYEISEHIPALKKECEKYYTK